MVHIVITSWYPYGKNEAVTAKWNENLQKFNEAAKSFKYFFKSVKEGVRATGYFKIEDEAEKFRTSWATLTALVMEFTAIEGFSFEMDVQYSMEELQAAQG
ncbi:MAG: hypothetical protein ACFE9R_05695 [Candidatus Hermodarchaeota archaeon]